MRQPFFCSAAAQAAATEALRHQDAVAERVERAIVARVEIADGLESLGLTAADSQANFCWFALPGHDGDDARETERRVVDELAQRGVLVRAGRRPRPRRLAAGQLRHAGAERALPARARRNPAPLTGRGRASDGESGSFRGVAGGPWRRVRQPVRGTPLDRLEGDRSAPAG